MNFPLFPSLLAEAYRPFMDPLPAWGNGRWPWLLIPLCVAVSIVYKSARCKSMKTMFREAMGLTLTIILGMIAAAIVLGLVVRGLER